MTPPDESSARDDGQPQDGPPDTGGQSDARVRGMLGDAAAHQPRRDGPPEPFPDPAVLAKRDHPRYNAAWSDLYARFEPQVRRAVTAGVRDPDDRDDVCAAIWTQAAAELPATLPRPAVSAWFWRVVAQMIAAYRRDQRARGVRAVRLAARFAAHQAEAVDDAQDGENVLARLVAAETAERRRAALARFFAERTPVERALLVARAHGVRHAEIARRLGWSPAASRQRLRVLVRLAREALAASREHR